MTISGNYILLKTAEVLQANRCNYCRLTYGSDRLYLEAMLSNSDIHTTTAFKEITAAITNMGGKLSIDTNNNIIQIQLSLPYCHQPKLTASLSHHVNNAVTKLNSRTRIQAIHQAHFQGYLSQNLT